MLPSMKSVTANLFLTNAVLSACVAIIALAAGVWWGAVLCTCSALLAGLFYTKWRHGDNVEEFVSDEEARKIPWSDDAPKAGTRSSTYRRPR